MENSIKTQFPVVYLINEVCKVLLWPSGAVTYYINDKQYYDNNEFQLTSNITDKQMQELITKFGNVDKYIIKPRKFENLDSNIGTGYIFYKNTNISKKSNAFELYKAKDFKKLDKHLDEVEKSAITRGEIIKE